MRDASALEAARAMIDTIETLACPRVIHSDQGAQFIGELFDYMSAFGFGTLRSIAAANLKEKSAIVERANKEVDRLLRSLIYESATSVHWSVMLPMAQQIINSTPHSITNVAPVQFVYGVNVDFDKGALIPWIVDTENPRNMHQYVAEMLIIKCNFSDR
jgi:hypothetical protein